MKAIASVLAVMFALTAATAFACPGDKAKDDKMSTPKKPTT